MALLSRLRECKGRDQAHEFPGLFLHRLTGAGRLFNECGILLRRFVHLHDCLVDLLDSTGLLLRSRRDLGNDVGHPLDRDHNLLQRLAGLIDQLAPVRHPLYRFVD